MSKNLSHGVIEFDYEFFSPDELATFAKLVNMTLPKITEDHIYGGNSPTKPGSEATLDVQLLLATDPYSVPWFWKEPFWAWLYQFMTDFFAADEVPYVISISYGLGEQTQCKVDEQQCESLGIDSETYVTRMNQEFMKLGLRGVTVIVASGDSGTNGRQNGFCLEETFYPSFPASSPYVTSVGATQLKNPKLNLQNPPPACQGNGSIVCASIGTEVAVSIEEAKFTSGGGFSFYLPMPDWQAKVVKQYLALGQTNSTFLPNATYYNASGRAYPDVSALGHSLLVYFQNSTKLVEGTSASAPIFAGIIARLNRAVFEMTGQPLGFINPLLYKMYDERPGTFQDVIEGNNVCTEFTCENCQGFTAAPGWDPVTGLGTPQYAKILDYLLSPHGPLASTRN